MKNRISVDPYTKIVLTVIALSLVWLCLTNARSVAPLGAQARELVDIRIRAIDRLPASRWDAVSVEADEALPTEVRNEKSIPVFVTNPMVPVDIKQATVKESLTPLERK
ncbi:MAG: hypothetical protein A2W03_16155 [Candidatus Aminicenantes bacterium RBG_16_63_16]|nr:MAG: hypothetical protein A2W03_16155 [Candidatus Aminicenantes bacterium RBG_16_63_16]